MKILEHCRYRRHTDEELAAEIELHDVTQKFDDRKDLLSEAARRLRRRACQKT